MLSQHCVSEEWEALSQILLCVAMVVRVSPSCEKTAPKTFSSSFVRSLANAFAIAVIDTVSSHGFIVYHLSTVYARFPLRSPLKKDKAAAVGLYAS